MKLVLSRKGFDSSFGGMPSPILPDGRLVPLPIPARHDRYTFRDLNVRDVPLEALLRDLSRESHTLSSTIHMDPDLDRSLHLRKPGWRPALGQTGAAQSHLEAKGVGSGDVFLFFGWFRGVELREGRWRFRRDAPHLHVFFGWLEIDCVLPIVTRRDASLLEHPWIADHPHVASPDHYDSRLNTLYVATKDSRFIGKGLQGGGCITTFHPRLQLTKAGATRSVWSLPGWFDPRGREPLSYHGARERWSREGERAILRSVAKGQEFVLNCDQYPEAEGWIRQIITGEA